MQTWNRSTRPLVKRRRPSRPTPSMPLSTLLAHGGTWPPARPLPVPALSTSGPPKCATTSLPWKRRKLWCHEGGCLVHASTNARAKVPTKKTKGPEPRPRACRCRYRWVCPYSSVASMFEPHSPRPSTSSLAHRSPSASPSSSPPPDFTTHHDAKGKGPALDVESGSEYIPMPERPASAASNPAPAGLQLGGARGWASLRPGRRQRQTGLNGRQRALWMWVNVDDLDGFLTDVRFRRFVHFSNDAGPGVHLLRRQRHLLHCACPAAQPLVS
jgi:hypothetical protein